MQLLINIELIVQVLQYQLIKKFYFRSQARCNYLKFADATNNAINMHEKLPEELQHVLNKDENFQVLKNNTEEVKNFVKSKV